MNRMNNVNNNNINNNMKIMGKIRRKIIVEEKEFDMMKMMMIKILLMIKLIKMIHECMNEFQ